MLRHLWVAGLAALASCNRETPAAEGGTIVLTVKSNRPVEYVFIKIVDPQNRTTMIDFETKGKDITQNAAVGEITPGMNVAPGPLMFVGFGYTEKGSTVVAQGRAFGEFVRGSKEGVSLSLEGDVVDVDQDGYAAADDCDDNASARNGFLVEKNSNDIDDDCDLNVDEGSPCATAQRRCYTGPEEARGVGSCTEGRQNCVAGVWGECEDSILPQRQLCNNRDDDCDGSVDEGCGCTPGSSRPCFGNSVGAGIPTPDGLCRIGTQACVGSAWEECAGAVYPRPEACNGRDDDCDGERDNGFDVDRDGYTSCGTTTAAAIESCSIAASDDVVASLKDCDDTDSSLHPCQVDRCGDMNIDDDCNGQHNQCQVALGNCGAAGFFAGWYPKDAGNGSRFGYECRRSAASFGTVCDDSDGECQSAAEQCPLVAGTLEGDVTFTRLACFQGLSCSGTFDGLSGPAIVDADPLNDCGGVGCDAGPGLSIYANTGAAGSGWVQRPDPNRPGFNRYECHVWPDVSGVDHRCQTGGGGQCESAAAACFRVGSATNNTVLSAHALAVIDQACQVPVTDSCKMNLGVPADPIDSTDATDGMNDPLSRCSSSSAGCTGRVVTSFDSNNTTCAWLTAATGPIDRCSGGVCATAINQANCTFAGSTVDSTMCNTVNTQCRQVNNCNAGDTINLANPEICFNANGGTPGGCGGDTTCYDTDSTGDRPDDAQCRECNQNFACGQACAACTGGSQCKAGIDHANGNPKNADPNGGDNACLCSSGALGNTIRFYCVQSAQCCMLNARCGSSGCEPASVNHIACGDGECVSASEYCDTQDVTTGTNSFSCQTANPAGNNLGAGVAPCNQRRCTGNNYCSNINSSTCTACTGTACNGACCTGLNVCGAAATSTCASCTSNTLCGETGENCPGGEVCAHENIAGGACTDYECVATADAGHKGDDCCGTICEDCTAGTQACATTAQTANPTTATFTTYDCLSATAGTNKTNTCCGPGCKTCGGTEVCASNVGIANPNNGLIANYDCRPQANVGNKSDTCCGAGCDDCENNERCASSTSSLDPTMVAITSYSCVGQNNAGNRTDTCCGEECQNCQAATCRTTVPGAPEGSANQLITDFACGTCTGTATCCGAGCIDCTGAQTCSAATCAGICMN